MMGWPEIETSVGNVMTCVDGSAQVSSLFPVFKIGGAGVKAGAAGSIPVHSRFRRTGGVQKVGLSGGFGGWGVRSLVQIWSKKSARKALLLQHLLQLFRCGL